MATAATNPKQQAHELIERISTAQASAVVTLITSMLDPVDRALANAPFDDEADQRGRDPRRRRVHGLAQAIDEAIPHEEVLAEFGLTAEDFERMGRTPLEAEPHHPGQ